MKFSVIIPVYGTEKYLSRCLESLRAQTDRDFEVIVVDDASPGDCAGAVRPFGYSVRYIRHARNRSAFQARATGIVAAKGDYVVPVDPDDYLMPETLAKLRAVIDRESPDVISYWIDYDDGRKTYPHWCRHAAATVTGAEALRELAEHRYFTGVASKAFRRETLLAAVRDLGDSGALYVNTGDDYLMLVPTLLRSARVSFLDYAGYRYFVNEQSTSFSWRTQGGYDRAFAQLRQAGELIRRAACRADVPTAVRADVESVIAGVESWFAGSQRTRSNDKVAFWSFVFVLGVVMIHCVWTPESTVGRLSVALFKDTLARLAVPFFFACSGFFLARHFDESGWWRREVRKRLRTLALPYVIWLLVLVAVMYAETHKLLGPGAFGLNPCRMPALSPLWYIRCLMMFTVLSPAFKFLIDRGRHWMLFLSYGVLLAFTAATHLCNLTDVNGVGGFFYYGFSLEGLFYFLGGMYVQRHWKGALSRVASVSLLTVGCAMIALRVWLAYRGVTVWIGYRCLVTPLVLVGIMGVPAPLRLPDFLKGCVFPIFLVHGVVLAAMRCWGGTYHACNPWLEFAAGVSVPILFCNFLRRVAPRVSGILFGGRA